MASQSTLSLSPLDELDITVAPPGVPPAQMRYNNREWSRIDHAANVYKGSRCSKVWDTHCLVRQSDGLQTWFTKHETLPRRRFTNPWVSSVRNAGVSLRPTRRKFQYFHQSCVLLSGNVAVGGETPHALKIDRSTPEGSALPTSSSQGA
jgi:hypothetical protein